MPRSARAELLSRRGASAVEFAAVGALAATMLIATLEVARYQFTSQALRSLAGEAARLASLRGAANMNAARPPCTGLSGPVTGLDVTAPFLTPARLTVTMSGCATQGAVTQVVVTVSQPFAFVTQVIQPIAPTMTETATAIFH
jgi:Flp pilus assembly protein TadG